MSRVSTPGAVYEALKKVIELPESGVVSLTLRLEVEKAPVVTIERHVILADDIEVTSLDSTARTYRPGPVVTTRTTRYHLVEISE